MEDYDCKKTRYRNNIHLYICAYKWQLYNFFDKEKSIDYSRKNSCRVDIFYRNRK